MYLQKVISKKFFLNLVIRIRIYTKMSWIRNLNNTFGRRTRRGERNLSSSEMGARLLLFKTLVFWSTISQIAGSGCESGSESTPKCHGSATLGVTQHRCCGTTTRGGSFLKYNDENRRRSTPKWPESATLGVTQHLCFGTRTRRGERDL